MKVTIEEKLGFVIHYEHGPMILFCKKETKEVEVLFCPNEPPHPDIIDEVIAAIDTVGIAPEEVLVHLCGAIAERIEGEIKKRI